jgi:hypothetical protein
MHKKITSIIIEWWVWTFPDLDGIQQDQIAVRREPRYVRFRTRSHAAVTAGYPLQHQLSLRGTRLLGSLIAHERRQLAGGGTTEFDVKIRPLRKRRTESTSSYNNQEQVSVAFNAIEAF